MSLLTNEEVNNGTLTVPLVALRDVVIFPHTETPLTFGRIKSNAAISAAFKNNKKIAFVCQRNSRTEVPGEKDFYSVGTLASIDHLIESNGNIHALVRGISRVRIENVVQNEPYFLAEVREDKETVVENDELRAMVKHVTDQIQRIFNLGKAIDVMVLMKLLSGVSYEELSNQVASILDLKPHDKQLLLEIPLINERLERVAERLSYEIKILELEKSIANKTQAKFDKGMREAVLRERKKTIEKELGELGAEDEEEKDILDLKEKIEKAKMTAAAYKKATEELNRLRKMSANNPEMGYIKTYLDWLVSLPWSNESSSEVSLKRAQKVLDEDHYGLEKIKERILEYLAVMKLKNESEGKKDVEGSGPTILCFIGPPGVGKTSLGKSIAKALGRKFVRVSLGGIRDEAEIRGHRRTYVGALPGRIIQGIKNAGTNNPVFMLDEIDKIGIDFRGDPSSALLEALDPEQNREFSDHYLEVPFDLSKVFFVATGNMLETIPPALRDRMEVIRFPGYTEEEKYNIAKNYLWPKQLKSNGLENKDLVLSDEALREIIQSYTREAGVRNLERNLASVCRKIAKRIAEGKIIEKEITVSRIRRFLGPERILKTALEEKDTVGMSTGLAWTEAGGEVLFVEVALMPGKGQLLLTGQLGDVMKESCQAAMTFTKSHVKELGINEKAVKNVDVHIHVPEGAVPKDGPSAGVAMATALVSAVTGKPAKKDVAMTGEITLRGRVLEIGGVKEKILAARRAGIKTVVLPKNNRKDLQEIPAAVKKDLNIVFVDNLFDAFKHTIKH
ncbi:endopeptidase La [Candidatus Microgenomates bacterium]|jgi:ATP-dependent Lon protease|nr:MAG: endopeptidase La [Candidatus Microgenomates bacterium]